MTIRQSIAVLVLVAFCTAQPPVPARFAVIEVGDFHGQDVTLEQPAAWVGVYCKQQRCRTKATTVRSTRAPDPMGDDPPDAPTGTSIEVSTREQPLFLVRGIPGRDRQLPTAFVGEHALNAGDRQRVSLAGGIYELRVEGHGTANDPLPKGSRLLLVSGSTQQELFSLPQGGNDPHITILWIGDLDGDGKPDFYIDASDHYNVSNRTLWLSSLAKHGQLVGEAATFATVGC